MAAAYPLLDPQAIGPTRDALHAYARVLGVAAASNRLRRKHWWHASLRPSIAGMTTGVIRGDLAFELELDLARSRLVVRTENGEEATIAIQGQPPSEVAQYVRATLSRAGAPDELLPAGEKITSDTFDAYDSQQARAMGRAQASVAAALERLRAGMREETSPIQIWSHHFDLSMLWLPGDKVPGQDQADEESADKQMNFGFVLGDGGIPEPYLYVTAYPLPDGMAEVDLPAPATWSTEGFTGVVQRYATLREQADPDAYLDALLSGVHAHGAVCMRSTPGP